jgi:hypothetical protein
MKKRHYPQCAIIDSAKKAETQQQLHNEIHWLERQLIALQGSRDAADFELINSYKTMLHGRHCLLNEIKNVSPMRL